MKHPFYAACLFFFIVSGPFPELSGQRDSLLTLVAEITGHEALTEEEQQRYPLGLFTEEAFRRRAEYAAEQIMKLRQLDTTGFTLSDEITQELMIFQLQEDIDNYQFKAYLNPILVDYGFHISFAFLPGQYGFTNAEDYRRYLRKLNAFPEYCRQHIELMRQGLREGISQPRIIMEGYEVTYDLHLVSEVEQSIFFAPFQRIPATFPAGLRDSLFDAGRLAVETGVLSGYRTVHDFFENEYKLQAREPLGASSMPRGREWYANRVRYYTTLDISGEEIHQIGLKEVARIQTEMEAVKNATGFRGTLQEFIAFLRTDPQFYAKTPQELLEKAAFHAKHADGQLPAFFGKLPRLPYGVAPVPDHLAPKYTGGRYVPGDAEAGRAGTYWVNTYALESRPLYVLESLTLHEAMPGHHLQMALTAELDHLPEFRRSYYLSAFGEGWGLYCEKLGQEMGFYQDPYSQFGRLTYEMWRACRLVVDTGIHLFGWTREQAMDYLADHTALSLHEVRTETDRYISWPGQALSYKIGELKILELRQKAETALGERFNIRRFHDALLAEGAVTLPQLERMVEEYIRKESL